MTLFSPFRESAIPLLTQYKTNTYFSTSPKFGVNVWRNHAMLLQIPIVPKKREKRSEKESMQDTVAKQYYYNLFFKAWSEI